MAVMVMVIITRVTVVIVVIMVVAVIIMPAVVIIPEKGCNKIPPEVTYRVTCGIRIQRD